jgi:hypothetical protein
MSIHRAAWEKMGGLDEIFDGAYGFEDTDFGLRVHGNGLRVGKAGPGARSEHLGEIYCLTSDGKIDESIMTQNRVMLEGKWHEDARVLIDRSAWGGCMP